MVQYQGNRNKLKEIFEKIILKYIISKDFLIEQYEIQLYLAKTLTFFSWMIALRARADFQGPFHCHLNFKKQFRNITYAVLEIK